jgi:hypothetical protein
MRINTGVQLQTFINGLNSEADIDVTLLGTLVDTGLAVIEEERPWMVLRKTDTSKTVTAGNTWQTAIDLSTITDFSRFYMNQDGVVIKLFDGNNRVDYITLKSFDQRLEYKDVSGTAVYDANSKQLYINGNVAFAGTLYIPYMATSPVVDLESDSAVWTNFPPRFLPLLGYYAIGIFKGAVDYDDINRAMLPENRATMQALKNALEKWDNEMALATIQSNDPSEFPGGYPRLGAVNRWDV